MNLAAQADHRVKWKESEKRDKYLDLSKELKKLRNIKVTAISIVIGELRQVTKILRRVEERCCHSNSWEKSSAKAKWAKLQKE